MSRVQPHDYHGCRDPECPLPYCRIWKEAEMEIRKAYSDGFRDGESAGRAAGYAEGMAAGMATAGGR